MLPLNLASNRPLIKEEQSKVLDLPIIDDSPHKSPNQPIEIFSVFKQSQTKNKENKITIIEKLSDFDNIDVENNLKKKFEKFKSSLRAEKSPDLRKSANLGFAFSYSDSREENNIAGRFKN